MSIKKKIDSLTEFFNEHIAPPHKIASIQPTEEGSICIVEVIEEREYMRKYAKDEMVGVYHVSLDKDNNVTAYTRRSLRPRSAMTEHEDS
ncbi:gas vesicle protein GvpO [Metabacillus arenae]|uniref:Gas vesicle protein n=1 Tax=Metabacillus arenae TaxID=2771434 RepID=A0A926NGM9_9BACI|nr:gas vesicle protein GvpO [Metabacillus arenae]MBD1380173.1 gas vesicle protein [Metabacillus arenae]